MWGHLSEMGPPFKFADTFSIEYLVSYNIYVQKQSENASGLLSYILRKIIGGGIIYFHLFFICLSWRETAMYISVWTIYLKKK